MGKTAAIEAAHQQVYEQNKNLEDICLPLFKLGDYGSDTELCAAIFRSNAFQKWLSGTHKLYLFLDSLDEGLLSIKILVRILKREINDLPCDRLCFRLTCRTAEWTSSLEEKLIEKWGEDNVGIYALAPLLRQDVIKAANENSIIDVEGFLQAISDRNAVPLAIKPITLKFLINIYSKEGKLPSSQIELYEKGCLQLCEEVNPDRCEAGEQGKLSSKKRRLIAGRIAAVITFCRQSAIWTSPEHGKTYDSDVSIQDLCTGQEQTDGQKFDVEEDYIREVFKVTGLFSAQACNQRIVFGHRTYAEFLAAWYLTQHNLSLIQILDLILHPDGRVVPQLQETAAWLASMIPEVFQQVMKTDPDVLLQSDISTIDDKNKAQLVESLLRLHNEEKLEYGWRQYNSLNYPGLAELLKSYIRDSSKNQWSRLVAIDIAQDCNVTAVQDSLAGVALNPEEVYVVRTCAAHTICTIGDEETKKRLKPLAFSEAGDDLKDDLKGYGLRAVWSQHITVEELLNHLSQPQQREAFPVIGGVYQDFIAEELAQHLQLCDLPVMLKWLEQLPKRYHLHYPFDKLADSVMLKAWQNLNEPAVLEAFSNIAILRLKQHDSILGDRPHRWYTRDNFDCTRDAEIEPLLRNSGEKRRQLIETIILLTSELESDFSWLTDIVCSEDILWIIERITSSESFMIADAWVKLLRQALTWHNLCWKNTKHIDAVLEARNISSAMQAEFEIELGSEKAKQAEASYLKYQNPLKPSEPEPTLEPPPKQRVLAALENVEAGQPQLWWQIVVEMILMPTSKKYIRDDIFKSDITELPGWKEAEADTKARIVKAAKKYLNAGDPETQAWVDTNRFSHPPFAGYQALYLLVKQEPEFVSKVSSDIWAKWILTILKSINFPRENKKSKEDEVCREIVRTAYQSILDEFIKVLIILMIHNNYQPLTFYPDDIYRLVNELLDQCLASLIFDRVPSEDVNAGMLEILLTDLFNHDIDKAKEIAKSFLSEKVPESGKVRNKAIVAARLLILHADNSSWSILWPLIQQNYGFGREVIDAIAFQAIRGGQIEQKIKEEYVADLYIFLVQQYPEIAQSEPKAQKLRGIEAQIEEFDGVRMWKNYILQRLQARGIPEACEALQKIIRELPEQKEQLQPRLLEAENLARRNTWKPLEPEEFLQLVISQDPSNSDLSDQIDVIDKRTKKMEDEPKIENKITISNSPNSPINAPVGTSGVTNSQVTVPSSDGKKGINWGNWLAAIGIAVAIIAIPLSMSVSGAFNEEFKQWLKHIFPSKVEQQPTQE
ncbi:MAG: hypothetical protein Kow00121_44680 [Elainellaceae cyanobacterium]